MFPLSILLVAIMVIDPVKSVTGQQHRETLFDLLYSDKPLGCIVGPKGTTFRLFAPRATAVTLVVFDRYDQKHGEQIAMARDSKGVWEYDSSKSLLGKYYGYRVDGPKGQGEMFNPKIIIGDPYSKAVCTRNNYHLPAKTLILETKYDWEDDTYDTPEDHNKLVIYEAHIRDLTADSTSGVQQKGTYAGLMEEGKTGGLSYLKDLGVNAIEFLPIQKFGTIELPYLDAKHPNDSGEVNTWNPYERNHWGYMTSYFFAPETYYATDGTLESEQYTGIDGRAVKEFKDLVKRLHRQGIAVLMDVVYNHVSQYDYNPFKYIDKFYYFRTDPQGGFVKASGCGNDFYTERPMARRLIVDSVKFWMQEYHIDGFRFDLAAMIDWETCKQIATEAKKINPNIILIAEAWGGGKYDPHGFSDIGWAAWNDQFRNGVKGQNPHDGLGFIFGKLEGGNSKRTFQNYILGTLRENRGMYLKKEHSINYLESHDDNTLGDFIRLGTGEVKDTQRIVDRLANAKLSTRAMALNKLAAMFLFVSQGPIMFGEGQEFARGKVIAPTDASDPDVGMLDHNSYNKDNETNYLNYNHKSLNQELYSYYKGLIALRAKHRIVSSGPKEAVEFVKTKDDFLLAFRLNGAPSPTKDRRSFFIILNGNPSKRSIVALPPGYWNVIGDAKRISVTKPIRAITKHAVVPPTSGMILMQK